MASRLELHEELKDLLGSNNVYFQPPSSHLMKYPAIRYSLSDINNEHAGNIKYLTKHKYMVTLITRNADDPCVDQLNNLQYTSYDRSYESDNLYHHVFSLYY